MNQIISLRHLGYRLYGILADYYHESLPKGYYLDKLEKFSEIVRSGLVDEVMIALPLRMEEMIIEMVEKCEREGIRVGIVPDFFRIIRSTAVLDNLGDMSVVGPRPELTYFVDKFGTEIDKYRVRHLVKSGISGLAQVNGWRGNTSKEKRIDDDIYCIENWSFWLDLKIIWRTFFGREARKHAY